MSLQKSQRLDSKLLSGRILSLILKGNLLFSRASVCWVWLLNGVFVLLCDPWLAMGWREQGKKGVRMSFGFSIAQTDLASEWAFDWLQHIWPHSWCWGWHLWGDTWISSLLFCGVAPLPKGAKCPTVLEAMLQALSKPLFLTNFAAPYLWAAALWLALGWTADALKKYLYKCDYVWVWVCVPVWVQLQQTHFISSVKITMEKNLRFLKSHAMLCVLAGRRRNRKGCVIAKLQPRSCHFCVWRCVCCLTCCHRHPVCAAFWQREEQEQAMFYRGQYLAMEKLCNMTNFV